MKNTIVVLITVVVTAVTAYLAFRNNSAEQYSQTVENGNNTPVENTTHDATSSDTLPQTLGAPVYTMAEVVPHNSPTSCWTVVRGTVYDLTSWINKHPGGKQAILSLCGRDGTSAFEVQHGGQSRPENTLVGFEVGIIVSQ